MVKWTFLFLFKILKEKNAFIEKLKQVNNNLWSLVTNIKLSQALNYKNVITSRRINIYIKDSTNHDIYLDSALTDADFIFTLYSKKIKEKIIIRLGWIQFKYYS